MNETKRTLRERKFIEAYISNGGNAGEAPSNYAIAKLTGMNKNTVREAVEGLKKKGIK